MRDRIWKRLIILSLLVALIVPSESIAQETEAPDVTRLRQSTVFLMQTYAVGGVQTLSCVGSGTLIGETGLILTNAHLVLPNGPCRGERLVVALPVRVNEPPVPTYLAEPVQIDLHMDLATLQITAGLDGSRVGPEMLNLPSVRIGDSSAVLQGQSLTFVGYPSIGNESVQAITGPVVSLTAERVGGQLAWLRTSAALGGGMGGGGAYNQEGELVGVITGTPGTDGEAPGPSCLSIQDTTSDGLITDRDACVPIPESVDAIRPINFALPLINAAQNGYRLTRIPGIPTSPPIEEPRLDRLFFSTQVDSQQGTPTQIITRLPSGARSLYLFFDYENMRPGMSYALRVTRDGMEVPQKLGLGPLVWGNSSRGTWYIGTENVTWADGNYEFTLFLDGRAMASASITVGSSDSQATFSNLTFGVPVDFTSTGTLLPAGIEQVDVSFDYQGMTDGQDWTEVWYYTGAEVFREVRLWDRGASGQTVVNAINYEGLPPGPYRLELYIGDRLAATGDLMLAGLPNERSEAVLFSNVQVASETSRDDLPAGVLGNTMPFGTRSLYAFFSWENVPAGLIWTVRWYQDGRLIAASTQPWDIGSQGEVFWVGLTANEALPEGIYAVEIMAGSRPMFSTNVTIGTGAGAIVGEAVQEGVEISGVAIDAITGEPVAGALIAILDVELESVDFTYDQSQIYTMAITDLSGRFTLPRTLQRGRYYTTYVFAEGYLTIVEDNFTIPSNQPSPTDIRIELTRP